MFYILLGDEQRLRIYDEDGCFIGVYDWKDLKKCTFRINYFTERSTMEYIHQTENFQFHNSAVALGKFDGLHRGHQLIFDQLLEYKKQGIPDCCIFF